MIEKTVENIRTYNKLCLKTGENPQAIKGNKDAMKSGFQQVFQTIQRSQKFDQL